MGTFAYIARTAAGSRVEGRIAGASEQAILAELQSRALAPVSITEVREAPRLQRRIGPRPLANAYRQLSDLVRAGVPLLRALRLLGRSRAQPRLAAVMAKIADEVADGVALADAMARHPDVFPEVQVAMVRAGERGGFLEAVLTRMGRFLDHQADLRSKVLGNLVYPIVLGTVMLGVIVYALVFLVPKFQTFYARIELPLPTKILLGASKLLTERWPVAIALVAGLVAAAWWVHARPEARRVVAAVRRRLPLLGPLTRDLSVGRFARILGTLLENGIPLIAAMQVARDAAGDPLLVAAITEATEAVRRGETLADPLLASGLFTEEAIEVIRVGESANNLADVLGGLADTLEKRVDGMMTMLLRLMEPALLLVMGGMVFFLFMALVVPMLRMTSSV